MKSPLDSIERERRTATQQPNRAYDGNRADDGGSIVGWLTSAGVPGRKAVKAACAAYRARLAETGDSRVAFEAMGAEVLRQLEARDRAYFADVQATYAMLPAGRIDALGTSHRANVRLIESYLFAMVKFIEAEAYASPDFRREERLKDAIRAELG